MRRARITYEGAFHHAMNRGINGDNIFTGSKNKTLFLDLMEGTAKKLKIKIGKRRKGDPAVLVASSEKIKKELGYNPKFEKIEKIIETAYRWHSNLAQSP